MKNSICLFLLKRISFCCFVLATFAACNKDLIIEAPYPKNKMVLNSLMAKDSIIYARVLNLGTINDALKEIDNASVVLYENNAFREKLKTIMINSSLFFVSTYKPITGKKYTLRASAPGKDVAQGTDIIPAKPVIQAISFQQIDNKYQVKIKLKDNLNEKNFYRLRLFAANKNMQNQIEINKANSEYFTFNNIDFGILEILGVFGKDVSYFTDETFDGKEITFTVLLENYPEENSHIAVEVDGLSYDTYKYLSSKSQQVDNETNVPFSDPVMVYNNIEGGYGIVGGIAKNMVVIKKQ